MGVPINPSAIIDFENQVTHKDVFSFNKRTYSKSQNYAPKKKTYKKRTWASAKKKKKATRRRARRK